MAHPLHRLAASPADSAAGEDARGHRAPAAARAPVVGMIFNPLSHRNRSARAAAAALPGVHIAAPEHQEDLHDVLSEFARLGVECLVVDGGDGTVRDVLTAGMPIFGDRWPALAVIPSGKTNALHIDLGAPKDWTLERVLSCLDDGRRVLRRPMIVTNDQTGEQLTGFVFGAGVFTTAINAGQDAHRLGAFNALAVGATTAWGFLQALFGTARNHWRRGVPMRIALGAECRPMPHARFGDPDRRTFLLAATLERLPFGMKVYGSLRGLKLAVMDYPRRRLVAAIPALLAGWEGDWLTRNGIHRVATDRIEITVEGRFILDGEAFPAGSFTITQGPELSFVVP